MTREEAIRIIMLSIRDSREHIRFCYDEKGITALNMAIQALQAQTDGEYVRKKDVMGCIGQTSLHFELARKLRKLPTVAIPSAEPKWIPVSEPPKELGTYLIQTDGEPYMCQCRWTDVNPFWTDYKTKPHWNIFDLPQYSKVVAWMPLPEPYKAESEVSNERTN